MDYIGGHYGIAGCGLIVSKVSAPIVTSAIATGISYFFIGCFLAKTIPLIIHKERIGYLSVGGLILSGILIAAFGTGGNLGLLTAFCFAPLLILSVLYVPCFDVFVNGGYSIISAKYLLKSIYGIFRFSA